MSRRKKGEPPRYSLHRGTGQACVSVGGQRTYFGEYGSPESYRRYREWLAGWERGETAPPPPRSGAHGGAVRDDGTMTQLAAAFIEHARTHYRRPDGQLTSEYRGHVRHLGDLLALHGGVAPADYRACHLDELRSLWVSRGWARVSVNKAVSQVRLAFRWAHVRGLVPAEVVASLGALPWLEAGRTAARETDPVPAVPEAVLRATAPFLRPAPAALAWLQWHAGMRPGEACALKAAEVRRDGTALWGRHLVRLPDPAAWVLQPGQYKTRHRGKFLAYVLGPRARELLAPWLADAAGPGAYLFASGRRECYREDSYRLAVYRACDRAGVPRWAPNQLRHAYISRVEREYDVLDACKAAGHSSPDTTLGYVHADLTRAAEIAARMG